MLIFALFSRTLFLDIVAGNLFREGVLRVLPCREGIGIRHMFIVGIGVVVLTLILTILVCVI